MSDTLEEVHKDWRKSLIKAVIFGAILYGVSGLWCATQSKPMGRWFAEILSLGWLLPPTSTVHSNWAPCRVWCHYGLLAMLGFLGLIVAATALLIFPHPHRIAAEVKLIFNEMKCLGRRTRVVMIILGLVLSASLVWIVRSQAVPWSRRARADCDRVIQMTPTSTISTPFPEATPELPQLPTIVAITVTSTSEATASATTASSPSAIPSRPVTPASVATRPLPPPRNTGSIDSATIGRIEIVKPQFGQAAQDGLIQWRLVNRNLREDETFGIRICWTVGCDVSREKNSWVGTDEWYRYCGSEEHVAIQVSVVEAAEGNAHRGPVSNTVIADFSHSNLEGCKRPQVQPTDPLP